MSLPLLKIGENNLHTFTFFQADGTTPRPLRELLECTAQLLNAGRVVAEYTIGTDDFKGSIDGNTAQLHISESVSQHLQRGELVVDLFTAVADADFPSGVKRSKNRYAIFQVI